MKAERALLLNEMRYFKDDKSSEMSHLGNFTKRWLIECSRTRKEYVIVFVEPSRMCGEKGYCYVSLI